MEVASRPASEATRLARVRRVYRAFVWIYDPFRRLWSRLTRRLEGELDALFASRIGPETRLLELAPGTGVNLVRLQQRAPGFRSYLGIDASPQMLARAELRAGNDARVELRLGDVTDLSAVPGPFDFVVSTWLLSHLERPEATVRAALERLAPGGTAAFLFSTRPTCAGLRLLLWPFYGAAAAGFVDPEPIRRLPGLERTATAFGGLATLTVFRRPPAPP